MTSASPQDRPTRPSPTRNALDVLRERGFVADATDEQALRARLDQGPVTFYVGFDPTAPSLHAGNLVGIMAMSWLQRLGHRPIAIAGGATGRIGDPSGRDSERELLDEQELNRNLAGIRRQLSAVMDLDGERGLLLDNYDWLGGLGFLDFLRDVGKHFSVNAMIARESVHKRLTEREHGISYTEFSYALLQAYDFAHLHRTYSCELQVGGSDQWGNITAGIDLIRRQSGAPAHGLVWPLLTTADGRKFGKSAGVSVWLDADMTSPYAYYQYWLNAADGDVARFLKLFTYLELDEIASIVAQHGQAPARRAAQRRLAEEATRILHGDDGLEAAQQGTAVLFGDEPLAGLDDRTLADAFASAPSVELPAALLTDGVGLLELLVAAGAVRSNGEARRLVTQGGVRLNNAVVGNSTRRVGADDLAGRATLVLRVGKKRYFLVRFT